MWLYIEHPLLGLGLIKELKNLASRTMEGEGQGATDTTLYADQKFPTKPTPLFTVLRLLKIKNFEELRAKISCFFSELIFSLLFNKFNAFGAFHIFFCIYKLFSTIVMLYPIESITSPACRSSA